MSDVDPTAAVNPVAAAAPAPAAPPVAPAAPAAPPAEAGNVTPPVQATASDASIAGGARKEEPEAKPYWNDDWRQKMADIASAGDEKARERELKRLERFSDPAAIYGMYRELEAKFSKGGLVKVPGKDATEEDIKAFHKAVGVPETPKAYVENLALPDGVKLGDADKELATDFATNMHSAGFTQSQMDQAMSWYFKNQEQRAAYVDQEDDKNRQESIKTLKEEYGPAFTRYANSIPAVFAYAPGGADKQNEKSLYNRLLAGRMADGRIIGDDPDMVRFLVAVAKEINPTATVVESADGSSRGVDDEIADIEKLMRTDRRAYDKDINKQARYRELLDARSRHRARNAA